MPGTKKKLFYAFRFPPQKPLNLRLTVVPGVAIDRAWSNKSGGSPWSSRESRTAWQNFRRKDRKRQNFQKTNWIGKTVFSGDFLFFGRGKPNFFGGGI